LDFDRHPLILSSGAHGFRSRLPIHKEKFSREQYTKMRLHSLKIKNLRTITDEQTLVFSTQTTLVGANNSGKSNTLLAVQYFFTGYENLHRYNHLVDLPYNLDGSGQTSLVAQFELDFTDSRDSELKGEIKRLSSWLTEHRGDDDRFVTIYLSFRRSSPIYQLYPGQKQEVNKRLEFGELQKNIIQNVLDRFAPYYIPSEKSIAKIYKDLVLPFVKKNIAQAILPFEKQIKDSIKNLSESMNASFADADITNVEVALEYPEKIFDNLIAGLEFSVQDSSMSSLYSKGMGLQSTVLFAALEWVTRQHVDKIVIWLIEEPETYMHPSLAYKTCKILDKIGQISTLIKTTHRLSFIPGETDHINGVELCRAKDNTLINKYKSYLDATRAIRSSLGVRFADFFGLSELNIFVEGETDEEYLRTAIKSYELRNGRRLLIGSEYVRFLSFGGCTELAGFLRANYLNLSTEVVAVSLFDGDAAAQEQITRLEGYFGEKGGFNSDRDYTIIPANGEIESVFPEEWIKQINVEHPSWFQPFRLDAAGNISIFKIKSGYKRKFMDVVLEYMKNPHHEEIKKLDVIVTTLEKIITRRLEFMSPSKLVEWQKERERSLTAGKPSLSTREWTAVV
jgi:predicted ATP-dependent endonuclease of OLD family